MTEGAPLDIRGIANRRHATGWEFNGTVFAVTN
jgi:hypothetical protein